MELWEQIVLGAAGLLILFLFAPGIKASIQRSKEAEQKHWGTVILLTIVLIAFVMLLISSVQ